MKTLLLFLFLLPFTLFSQNDYITNKEYNEFVTYVRDSLLRQTMGEEVDEEAFIVFPKDEEGDMIGVNWKEKLDVNFPEAREALEPWYYTPSERLNRKREFDTRKFIHNGVKVYPDPLFWVKKSAINKSWAIFLSKYYFTHPYFKDYPVQGLSKQQILEYLKWKYPNQEKWIKISSIKEINLTLPKDRLQISIGDYYSFYEFGRDSIIRLILDEEVYENKYTISKNKYNEELDPPFINWKPKIEWKNIEVIESLKTSYLTPEGKIYNGRVIYNYHYLDYYKSFDPTDRSKSFVRKTVVILSNMYIPKTVSTNDKTQSKIKTEIDYSRINFDQLKAFTIGKNLEKILKTFLKDLFQMMILLN